MKWLIVVAAAAAVAGCSVSLGSLEIVADPPVAAVVVVPEEVTPLFGSSSNSRSPSVRLLGPAFRSD